LLGLRDWYFERNLLLDERRIKVSVTRIDNKHAIFVAAGVLPRICKRLESGELQPIPDDEPVMPGVTKGL